MNTRNEGQGKANLCGASDFRDHCLAAIPEFSALCRGCAHPAYLPLALVSGAWLDLLASYNFSVAVGVGFIALWRVAVETGVIMLVYLNQSWQRATAAESHLSDKALKDCVIAGAEPC